MRAMPVGINCEKLSTETRDNFFPGESEGAAPESILARLNRSAVTSVNRAGTVYACKLFPNI